MMNEAATPVTTPAQMVDAVVQIETAINDEIGTNFGAATGVFTDVLKGKTSPAANAVRKLLAGSGDQTMGGGNLNPAIDCVKAICVANGRNDITVEAEWVMAYSYVAVNGSKLTIRDEAVELAKFMRANMR